MAEVQPTVTTMVCMGCKSGDMRNIKDQIHKAIRKARRRRVETAASIYLEAKCSCCSHTVWLDANAVSHKQRTCGMARCQIRTRTQTQDYRDASVQRNHTRRTITNDGDDIKRSLLWERDMGICHICNEAADRNYWHLDHIIPIARGGTHTWDNVAVSHPACNLSKVAKLAA
jgi:5-methylcytosine-specific restriction endonuclease McrA